MCGQEKGQRRVHPPTPSHQQRIKGRRGGFFQSCLEQGARELGGERTQKAGKEGPRPDLAWPGEPWGRRAPKTPEGKPGLLEGSTSALPQELPWVQTATFWEPVSGTGNVIQDPVIRMERNQLAL